MAFIKISISLRLTPINRSINLAINFKNLFSKSVDFIGISESKFLKPSPVLNKVTSNPFF